MQEPIKVDPSAIESHLKQLTAAAKALNELSDTLTTQVGQIEAIVNALNLGVRASVQVETLSLSEDHFCRSWLQLGYGKSGNKWGFIVEELFQDLNNPDGDDYDCWPFKEAPREFRIKAVDKIPELLEALVKKSAEVASDITKRVEYAKDIASNLYKLALDGPKK